MNFCDDMFVICVSQHINLHIKAIFIHITVHITTTAQALTTFQYPYHHYKLHFILHIRLCSHIIKYFITAFRLFMQHIIIHITIYLPISQNISSQYFRLNTQHTITQINILSHIIKQINKPSSCTPPGDIYVLSLCLAAESSHYFVFIYNPPFYTTTATQRQTEHTILVEIRPIPPVFVSHVFADTHGINCFEFLGVVLFMATPSKAIINVDKLLRVLLFLALLILQIARETQREHALVSFDHCMGTHESNERLSNQSNYMTMLKLVCLDAFFF